MLLIKFMIMTLFFTLSSINSLNSEPIVLQKLRKYENVKKFYAPITKGVIELCVKNNLPPAAILAMSGLESGYGSGYVFKITANVLSLGARKGDKELPALHLATIKKTGEVIIDLEMLKNYNKNEYTEYLRPPSLKKDYRPDSIAGTNKNLIFFTYHQKQKQEAIIACFKDFITKWITINSKVPVFKQTKASFNHLVKHKGKQILFSDMANNLFLKLVGGRKRSFNFRPEWVTKTSYILKNTGLVKLTKNIYIDKQGFDEAWSNHK